MGAVLLMGFRNLFRRKFRTILTVLMIFGGTLAVVFLVGLSEGVYGHMTDLATRTFTGHFQVMAQGYHHKPGLFKTIKEPQAARERLEQTKGVTAVTARVETGGLLSAGTRTLGVELVGVDPDQEPKVTTLSNSLDKGEWFKSGPYPDEAWPIIIGSGVAQRLKASPGDQLSFVTQAADGSLAAELFVLTGIIKTGADELDSGLVLIRLADAQEMLVLSGRIHRLVGVVRDMDQLDGLKKDYQNIPGNELLTWSEILPLLKQSIEADRGGLGVTLIIILIVVLLGVSNTMMMTVLERTRELGVMQALGSTPGRMIMMLVGEAGWLTLLGVGGGTALGSLLNWLTTFRGIPMGDSPFSFGGVVISEMVAVNGLRGNLYYPLLILACGLVAGVLPAFRAARLQPAQALRTD